jgi:hypothetical protein
VPFTVELFGCFALAKSIEVVSSEKHITVLHLPALEQVIAFESISPAAD